MGFEIIKLSPHQAQQRLIDPDWVYIHPESLSFFSKDLGMMPVNGLSELFTSIPDAESQNFKDLWGSDTAAAGESVSITLSADNYVANSNPLQEGVLIRINGRKRVWGKVTQTGSIQVTVKSVYRPAPKSKLNRFGKTPFSKINIEIIRMNTL